jgi:Family of unknown function (DUF695)
VEITPQRSPNDSECDVSRREHTHRTQQTSATSGRITDSTPPYAVAQSAAPSRQEITVGLFGRRPKARTAQAQKAAIATFWTWWDQNAQPIADSIATGELERFIKPMSARVHAIDPGLSWEFGAGDSSRNQLTITAEGDPQLRRTARQWLREAPPADQTWSFHDLRQASGLNATLQLNEATLVLSEITVTAIPVGSGLNVTVHHPAFAGLSDAMQAQISALALDAALGEEAVELWIGTIEHTPTATAQAIPLGELSEALAEVIAEYMPDGEMAWTMLRGTGPRGLVQVLCLTRLASVQSPDFDQHVAITVPFSDITDEGLAGEAALDELRAFSAHLDEIVEGSGKLVAEETSDGVRILHYYVDSTTPASEQLQVATRGWRQGVVEITTSLDPSWHEVAAFRS